MKTYKFQLNKLQKDAIYAALYSMVLRKFDPEVYTPSLTTQLLSENPDVDLTQPQLHGVLNALSGSHTSFTAHSAVHPYEQTRLFLLAMSRERHSLIC